MNRQSAGNKELCVNLFKEGLTITQISVKAEIPYGTVWNYLNKAGLVKRKTKRRVYSKNLNKKYFYNIDSVDKAYFLGFIKADGYIDKKRNRLAIRIQDTDVEILRRFCDAVGLNQKRINTIPSKKKETQRCCVEVSITSEEFVKPLLDIKTAIPELNGFNDDFIRGYFDGDGSVYYRSIDKNQFALSIVGNPNDTHMLDFINKKYDISKIYWDKRSNLPFIKTALLSKIIKFSSIYNSFLYMSRKKIKFDLIRFRHSLIDPQRLHAKQPEKVEDIV